MLGWGCVWHVPEMLLEQLCWGTEGAHRRADSGSNQSQVVGALEKHAYKWRLQLVENGENIMKKRIEVLKVVSE